MLSRFGKTVNCLLCPWGSIARPSMALWSLLLRVKWMWGKERVIQKGEKCLPTIVTNCGINSQLFHNGFTAWGLSCAMDALLPFFTTIALNQTKRWGGSFFSCVQRRPVAEQFLLTETITLFIENKCWHLEGAAAGEGWEGGREAGPLCALEIASGAIWQQCWVSGGNPPENRACISINHLLMKVFGLKKKKLAAGAIVCMTSIGGSKWSKGK